MLFACSVQDVVNAKASEITVSGNDFDVGYHFTETSAALTADYSKAPDFFDSHGNGIRYTAKTAPNPTTCAAATLPRSLKQPYKYWEGATTKASLCEAVLNTYSQYRLLFDATPYAFGRDIRRLSCEAKA